MRGAVAKKLLHLFGWQIPGVLPKDKQYIMIVAPHTSNWDFVIGVLACSALNLNIHFLAKHQLFTPPWGWLFKALGGKAVDRRKNNNLVDAVSDLFKQDPNFCLALAPEGSRSQVKRWKTGFYHIAYKAEVPIVPVGFDFLKKEIVITDAFRPTGEIVEDMQALIAFFKSINGLHPKDLPDFTY